nr:restriction endonuclease subunit S [Providencia rettgeri]
MENITSTPKYDQYIDSGYEWIGEIPAHWDLVKLGSCLSPVSVKNCSELPLLSITREQGVIERDVDDQESNHNFIPDDLSGYKKLEKGQFGMNKMKAWQGSYGVSKFTGIVSPAYFVFDFTKVINPEFFNWAIRSKLYVSFFGSASDGVRIGQWDLSKTRMKVIPFVLPSEEEQVLIANFLDKKTALIDEAISIKEKQISLLKERKQIIIQQAVTQGLDPNVPMKDSGVDWIGQIPEHWEVVPLKRLLAEPLKYGANESGYDYHPELPRYIRITDFSGEGKLNDEKKLSLPWEIAKDYLLKDGDILLARSGATVGKSYQFKTSMSEDTNYCFAGYLIKATHDPVKITSEFLNLFLNSDCFQAWKALIFNKATIENIGADKYSVLPVIVPEIEEQNEIFNKVCDLSEPIDGAIAITFDQIEKLKEYKTSLINSAVTGKIKITPEMVEQ